MSTPSKAYMDAYRAKNAKAIKSKQLELDRKKKEERLSNPEALAKYKARKRSEYMKKHPNAKTMEELREDQRRKRGNDQDAPKTESVKRICRDCGQEKPLEDYPKHGPRGRKPYCKECGIAKPKDYSRKAEYVNRNREKVNALKRESAKRIRLEKAKTETKKPGSVESKDSNKTVSFTEKYAKLGWVRVFGFGDMVEQLIIYIRGPIILFQRGQLGTYSTGKATYAIVGDDSGARYNTLSTAEKHAQKIGYIL